MEVTLHGGAVIKNASWGTGKPQGKNQKHISKHDII